MREEVEGSHLVESKHLSCHLSAILKRDFHAVIDLRKVSLEA
jgi:hypothetical protein